MDLQAYRAYSDAQLAEEIVWLRTHRRKIHTQLGMGDRTAATDLKRIDGMWKAACLAWKERAGEGAGLPTDENDTPGRDWKNEPMTGSTDFGDTQF